MEAKRRRYEPEDSRTSYVDGSTVRKLNAVPERRREERIREMPAPQRRPHRKTRAFSGINLASLTVLTVATVISVLVCAQYLQLQWKVSSMEKSIVSMEKNLKALTNENNAAYATIDTQPDLGYIYKVAVEELGMVYPNKNEVITYKSQDDGYVRQYEDIPE
ncbi:MAG TPA: cell division protein FtsL [Clostridiales bacterium]|nr:cell division protein FtsL [Clostridiales bacterium]